VREVSYFSRRGDGRDGAIYRVRTIPCRSTHDGSRLTGHPTTSGDVFAMGREVEWDRNAVPRRIRGHS
jgi:hypothetical protein